MKYKIGDNVCYDGDKYTIVGACEESTVTYDENNSVTAHVDIYYDLEDDCGIRLDEIPEEDLREYSECSITSNVIKLKNGATYKLKNNMMATYEEVNDLVITDEGISIPGHFYDKEGKCSAYASFDIVEELWSILEEDDDNGDDFDPMDDWWSDWCNDETNDEDDDENEEDDKKEREYPLTLTGENKEYYITFDKGAFGWSFHGNLPKEIEEFLGKILNGRG